MQRRRLGRRSAGHSSSARRDAARSAAGRRAAGVRAAGYARLRCGCARRAGTHRLAGLAADAAVRVLGRHVHLGHGGRGGQRGKACRESARAGRRLSALPVQNLGPGGQPGRTAAQQSRDRRVQGGGSTDATPRSRHAVCWVRRPPAGAQRRWMGVLRSAARRAWPPAPSAAAKAARGARRASVVESRVGLPATRPVSSWRRLSPASARVATATRRCATVCLTCGSGAWASGQLIALITLPATLQPARRAAPRPAHLHAHGAQGLHHRGRHAAALRKKAEGMAVFASARLPRRAARAAFPRAAPEPLPAGYCTVSAAQQPRVRAPSEAVGGHAEPAAAPGARAPACSRARCAQSRSTRPRRAARAHSSVRVLGACLRRVGAPGASATCACATRLTRLRAALPTAGAAQRRSTAAARAARVAGSARSRRSARRPRCRARLCASRGGGGRRHPGRHHRREPAQRLQRACCHHFRPAHSAVFAPRTRHQP